MYHCFSTPEIARLKARYWNDMLNQDSDIGTLIKLDWDPNKYPTLVYRLKSFRYWPLISCFSNQLVDSVIG